MEQGHIDLIAEFQVFEVEARENTVFEIGYLNLLLLDLQLHFLLHCHVRGLV